MNIQHHQHHLSKNLINHFYSNLLMLFFAAILLISLTGCNSIAAIAFFPAAPAQKAADKVIDDIWPTTEGRKLAKESGTAIAPLAPSAQPAPQPVTPAATQTGTSK